MMTMQNFRPAPFSHLLTLKEISGETPDDARTSELAGSNAEFSIRKLLEDEACITDAPCARKDS